MCEQSGLRIILGKTLNLHQLLEVKFFEVFDEKFHVGSLDKKMFRFHTYKIQLAEVGSVEFLSLAFGQKHGSSDGRAG